MIYLDILQVRYVRYTAKTQPNIALDAAFKDRLRLIAAHLEMNKTALATYESQLVVRDFGTHVTTSVDIGAALVQVYVYCCCSFDKFKLSSFNEVSILE